MAEDRSDGMSSAKLTKKFFMALPVGTFVVSNSLNDDGTPVFAEATIAEQHREMQWQAIRDNGVNGNACVYTDDEAAFKNFLDLVGGTIQDARMGQSRRRIQPLARGTLTKAFIEDLPENAYLMSNSVEKTGEPSLLTTVGSLSDRDRLWNKIKGANLANRRCYVFDSEQECRRWAEEFPKDQS